MELQLPRRCLAIVFNGFPDVVVTISWALPAIVFSGLHFVRAGGVLGIQLAWIDGTQTVDAKSLQMELLVIQIFQQLGRMVQSGVSTHFHRTIPPIVTIWSKRAVRGISDEQ